MQVDVLIVGLGPAGARAATTAAEAGLRVLAIDKRHRLGEPVQCAEFIPLPLAKLARSSGIIQQRITHMTSHLPSGHHQDNDFPGLMIDRGEFDRALAAQAEAAGAQIACATYLRQLMHEKRQALVTQAGQPGQVSFKLVIATDGPHSGIAKSLGLPPLSCVVSRQYQLALRQPLTNTQIWLDDAYAGGYAWLFPRGDRANLGLGMAEHLRAQMKPALDALHARLCKQGVVGEQILKRTGGAIPVGGLRKDLVHGPVIFAGDAAGFTHPITGAGIAAAVQSGEAAGEAVASYLKGDADALQDYDEDMQALYASSLSHAVHRRTQQAQAWGTPAAHQDSLFRSGWIAFDEYYEESLA